jgi:hypothetical protein
MPQTIPLQTAQQLQQVAREKNYTLPESEYSFIYMYIGEKQEIEPKLCVTKEVEERYKACLIPAYTIEELLKEISWEYVLYKTPQNLWNTFNRMTEVRLSCPFSDSPQEALAQLLIYLIENELIKN